MHVVLGIAVAPCELRGPVGLGWDDRGEAVRVVGGGGAIP